ncbi:putative basic amino acid antiporter YfcC [Francisella tularensis subsp. novicida]|uniref:putative basic amino acid antiporter YfcC n=1 Tax=Francisella tularensis TaxID=263 RepID=UPI0005167D0F|nr:putative basic amino acid antiporter YfcC [Francisella tularensis]MBK2343950.1 putative basic amino acid antiporter YfcC [Francisella tularensis subsp. novicida]MBK2349231.1 putative basic amino acid antiporter YfcC [Francisella tularensis subsp. novicida]MBK2352791.1 putative basic amino acid antiporter YfcC [Francisella tularensis subsp. novicida]MBK2354586.1 putative basic amino acid antiporter YfcC [Francisella tularensis subsp. novicida]MBK2358204.1 putative basic amino acid antiporter
MKSFRKIQMPDTLVILFCIAILVAITSYFIPVGKFDVKKIQYSSDGQTYSRSVLIADSFKYKLDSQGNPKTAPVKIFATEDGNNRGFTNFIYDGITSGSKDSGAVAIIAFLLIIGGSFGVLLRTKVIDQSIIRVVNKFQNNKIVLLPLLCFIFSLGGAVFGMGEETIPFILLLVPIFVLIGFDALTCTVVIYLATQIGFATSWMNPFSVSIAQGIAELPILSGSLFRIIMWFIFTLSISIFAVFYALKIQKTPQSSTMYIYDNLYRNSDEHSLEQTQKMCIYSWLILASLIITIVWLVYGVVELGYYIPEIATLFTILGLLTGLFAVAGKVNGMNLSIAIDAFKNGAKDLLPVCLIIGFAYGLIYLMGGSNPEDYTMLNTILHYASEIISGTNQYVSALGMFFFQSIFNFFVTSGSGQAALTMPIMSPLADLTGLSRQIAVLAFQLGDGWTHCLMPTSATLMAVLGVARIPYGLWLKFIFKFYLYLMTLSSIMIVIAVYIGYK